ncbi:RidA family protein [Streptomyces sp. NPDC058686]|uniref:RidA family protein n=1 Tax=Streptomyces sp. NPDC058686 TaxID=3346599 RepID=UPI00366117BB
MYVTDMDALVGALPYRKRMYVDGPFPTSATVQVKQLIVPGLMIEIEVVASRVPAQVQIHEVAARPPARPLPVIGYAAARCMTCTPLVCKPLKRRNVREAAPGTRRPHLDARGRSECVRWRCGQGGRSRSRWRQGRCVLAA